MRAHATNQAAFRCDWCRIEDTSTIYNKDVTSDNQYVRRVHVKKNQEESAKKMINR